MSRLFISHSGANNPEAVALRDWLAEAGWDDVFLDVDPEGGIKAGERWKKALNDAASRCEAVLFLISPAWLDSEWCREEFDLARHLNKLLFGLVIATAVGVDALPERLKGTWQVVDLTAGKDHRRLRVILPRTHEEVDVTFSQEGLVRLRGGLTKAGLDPRFFDWPPARDPDRPPYRGLRPLEAEDAGIFFGRDAPVVEALDRLRGLCGEPAPRLVVILGASGSGKSSFLRAGMLPRLARDDRNFLPLPVIRPERAALTGDSGLVQALEAALVERGIARPRAEIRAAVAGGAKKVRPLLQRLVEHALSQTLAAGSVAKPPTVVLAVDQAEELFHSDGLAEGAALLGLAHDLVSEDAPAAIVLFTIRSDSYDRLQTAQALEGLRQHTLPLMPMPRGAYQTVIEGPAARLSQTSRRLVIEPGLTQRLLEDIEKGGGSDALPLLAFTMEQLYLDYGRGSSRLRLADYEAFGGIRGAIEAAVERALIAADAEPRIPRERDARLALLRRGLIPWLAGIDSETGSPRRRIARLTDVPAEALPLIQLLVEQRLLATDRIIIREGDREVHEVTIEPAHEAILRQWGLLRGWLEEDFAALTTLEGVKRAARDWAANAQRADWLNHTGTRLEEAEKFAARRELAGDLTAEAHAYLQRCRERDEAGRREREAALAREAARLAEITAAQTRTARLQRARTLALAAVAFVVGAGVIAVILQQLRLNARQRSLDSARDNLLAELAAVEFSAGNLDGALRFAVYASRLGAKLGLSAAETAPANAELDFAVQQSRWRLVLNGHEGMMYSAAFSPDGKRIVTASGAGIARIWNATTGQQIVLLRGHEGLAYSATFSLDGRRVVTASFDRTARIWDAASGRQIALLAGHEGAVFSAAFSPDGKRVVTASGDKTVRIWDAASGQQAALLTGHEAAVRSAAFSPDGNRIVTASFDRTVRIWDAATGQQTRLLRGPASTVLSATFSPDGKRIVTAWEDKTARIWDAASGQQIGLLGGHEGAVFSAAFSSDGKRIVTASFDGTARIWDAMSGEQIGLLSAHEGIVTAAAFSLDGKRIVTATGGGTARIWDAAGPQLALLRAHEGMVYSAAFSPDGKRIVTACFRRSALIWDAMTGQQLALLRGHEGAVHCAAFSPNGTRIVTASFDRTARIWDAATGEQIALLGGHDGIVATAAFSPDGKRIVTASNDKTARIWDAASGRQIGLLHGHEGAVASAAFSADGKRIVTASNDKTARIWDAATGQQIGLLRGHEGAVATAAFSPDGKRIVTASYDRTVRIWDAASGQQVARLRGHENVEFSAAFSPDGERIVTAAGDKTARIWDVATGQQLALLRGHEGAVTSAAFSPGGKRIVTASFDATARIWDVRFATMAAKDLVVEACTRRLRGISTLTRYEMSLAGYPEDMPLIDVCKGIE